MNRLWWKLFENTLLEKIRPFRTGKLNFRIVMDKKRMLRQESLFEIRKFINFLRKSAQFLRCNIQCPYIAFFHQRTYGKIGKLQKFLVVWAKPICSYKKVQNMSVTWKNIKIIIFFTHALYFIQNSKEAVAMRWFFIRS